MLFWSEGCGDTSCTGRCAALRRWANHGVELVGGARAIKVFKGNKNI